MLIIGAKGFAKEVLEIFYQINVASDVVFFDNISLDLPEKLYDKYDIIRDYETVKDYFYNNSNKFILGIGNPANRHKLSNTFTELGGVLESVISPFATIGHFGTSIGVGVNIMTGVRITNDVMIADGCLINLNCTIAHNSKIEKFCELSPGVHISGNCAIGEYCSIGTGAVILPNLKIGNNVTIGAGAVVVKNVEDNDIVVGVPAKKINYCILN